MSDPTLDSASAIESTLGAVDRALERMRAGTYRTCEHCQGPIERGDLVADPLLATCRAHRAPA